MIRKSLSFLLLNFIGFTTFCQTKTLSNIELIQETGSSTPHGFISYNDKVYFSAYSPQTGNEIWVTDGTTEGTSLLKELKTGSSGNCSNLAVLNGTLFFTENESVWKSNGTAEGTSEIKSLSSEILQTKNYDVECKNNFFACAGNSYYFVSNHLTFRTLWKSNGQAEGTVILDTLEMIEYLFGFIDKLFFAGYKKGISSSLGLWVSDGTKSGTKCIKDSLYFGSEDCYPWNYIIYKNKLFFTARRSFESISIYSTDGTAEGTKLVKGDIHADIDDFTELNGYLYFTVDGTNTELWRTDGTEIGTILIKELNSGCTNCNYNLKRVGDSLYFNDFKGNNLWISDGTSIGTSILKTIPASSSGYDWNNFTEFKGNLYFNSEIFNNTLSMSDGTEQGTKSISSITVFPDGNYQSIFAYDDYMLICADDGIHGYELWILNGTLDGASFLKDINQEPSAVLDNESTKTSLLAFPNPIINNCTIRLPHELNNSELKLYNYFGELLYTDRINNRSVINLEMSSFPDGLYFIKVNSTSLKIIKKSN